MNKPKEAQKTPYTPKKTYFYKRVDGDIIAVQSEKEAAINHNYYEQIGVSDGTTYKKVIDEQKEKLNEIDEEIEKHEKKLEKLEDKELDLELEEPEGEDKGKWKRKMRNLEKKQRKLNKKLEKLYNKKENFASNIQQKAFEAELKEARGNKENPNYKNVTVFSDKSDDGKQITEKELQDKFKGL